MDSITVTNFKSPDGFIIRARDPKGFVAPITNVNCRLTCSMPKYGIDVIQEPSSSFHQTFLDELRFLWDAYANESDRNLDTEAQAVKRALNEAFEQTTMKAWQTPQVVETTDQTHKEAF